MLNKSAALFTKIFLTLLIIYEHATGEEIGLFDISYGRCTANEYYGLRSESVCYYSLFLLNNLSVYVTMTSIDQIKLAFTLNCVLNQLKTKLG